MSDLEYFVYLIKRYWLTVVGLWLLTIVVGGLMMWLLSSFISMAILTPVIGIMVGYFGFRVNLDFIMKAEGADA